MTTFTGSESWSTNPWPTGAVAPASAPAAEPSAARARVLILADEDHTRRSLTLAIDHAGFELIAPGDLYQALAYMRSNLAVVVWQWQAWNGEASECLRHLVRHCPHTQLLALTPPEAFEEELRQLKPEGAEVIHGAVHPSHLVSQVRWAARVSLLLQVDHDGRAAAAVASEAQADRDGNEDRLLPGALAGKTLAQIEKRAILDTLQYCDGNKALAARTMGISEKSIYNKMKRHGLPLRPQAAEADLPPSADSSSSADSSASAGPESSASAPGGVHPEAAPSVPGSGTHGQFGRQP